MGHEDILISKIKTNKHKRGNSKRKCVSVCVCACVYVCVRVLGEAHICNQFSLHPLSLPLLHYEKVTPHV